MSEYAWNAKRGQWKPIPAARSAPQPDLRRGMSADPAPRPGVGAEPTRPPVPAALLPRSASDSPPALRRRAGKERLRDVSAGSETAGPLGEAGRASLPVSGG